jgi:hypothetical protein
VDDVRFYTCAVGSRPGPSATNLLKNPGMEWDDNDDGAVDAWSLNAGALRMAGPKHAGLYSLKLGAAAAPPTGEQTYSINQKASGVLAGNQYVVSGWLDIPTTANTVNTTLQVQWLNSAGAAIGSPALVKAYIDDTVGVWNSASKTLTAPTGATSAKVMLVQGNPYAAAYVDDVVFKHA